MTSGIEDTGVLQVPSSNRRRLSLVQNDDFVFQSCKRKEIKSDDPALIEQNEYGISNLLKEVNSTTLPVLTQTAGFSANDINREDYHPIWKYSDNPSLMRYRWLRTLRTKIMNDLTRHFGREVLHDRLLSCLSYDFAFCQFLVTFVFVAAWIGTWQNLDSLFDTLLFNGDKYYSSIASLGVGALFSVIIIFGQEQVRVFAEKGGVFRCLLVSRIFSIVRFEFEVLQWKGCWGIFDNVIGARWELSVGVYAGCSLILLVLGAYSTALGTPIGFGIDRPSKYIHVSTLLSKQSSDQSIAIRLLDAVLSDILILIAASAFYGLWSMWDFFFDDHNNAPEVLGTNALICLAVGIAVSWMVFGAQFLLLYLHADDENGCKGHSTRIKINVLGLCIKEIALKFCWIYVGYAFMLVVAFFGAVSQFRGYWNLIDVYFISGNKLVCRIICQFYGMLLLFLLYCGTSLHGGIFLERTRYTNGIMFPNFFLTYMLATKLESKKSYVLNVVGNPSESNLNAKNNWQKLAKKIDKK